MYRYVISRPHAHHTILHFDDLRKLCASKTDGKALKLITDLPTLYRDFQYLYELRIIIDNTGTYYFDATPSAIDMTAHLLYIRQYIHSDLTFVQFIAYRYLFPLTYQRYVFDRLARYIPHVPRAIPLFDTHSETIQKRIADGYELNALFEF